MDPHLNPEENLPAGDNGPCPYHKRTEKEILRRGRFASPRSPYSRDAFEAGHHELRRIAAMFRHGAPGRI